MDLPVVIIAAAALVFVIMIVGVIASAVNRARVGTSTGPGSNAGTRIVTRPTADGFWVDAPGLDAGTEILLRFLAGNRWCEERALIAAPGQSCFVYTGVTPEQIAVVAVGSASVGSYVGSSQPMFMPTPTIDVPSSLPSTSSSYFPSAY